MTTSADHIRPNILAKIRAYADNHEPTGDFLKAVFENDLFNAIARADEDNLDNIIHIVKYIYNETPALCWGSPAKVKAWLKGPMPEPEGTRSPLYDRFKRGA